MGCLLLGILSACSKTDEFAITPWLKVVTHSPTVDLPHLTGRSAEVLAGPGTASKVVGRPGRAALVMISRPPVLALVGLEGVEGWFLTRDGQPGGVSIDTLDPACKSFPGIPVDSAELFCFSCLESKDVSQGAECVKAEWATIDREGRVAGRVHWGGSERIDGCAWEGPARGVSNHGNPIFLLKCPSGACFVIELGTEPKESVASKREVSCDENMTGIVATMGARGFVEPSRY